MDDDQAPKIHRQICSPSSAVCRLIIATHNPGKLAEMRDLLAPYGIDATSAGELKLPEPDETGMTFRDNARIKATAAAQATGLPAFADDSGLAVDALDGAPGIYSARWAGPDKNFHRAMAAVDEKLRQRGAITAECRHAHFVSALCVAWPDGHLEEFDASVSGTLVWPPRGSKGFGYDPMFLPDGHARTFGEMSSDEKHGLPPRGQGLSHRARAFLKLAQACLSSPPPRTGEVGGQSAPRGGQVVSAAQASPDPGPPRPAGEGEPAFGVYIHWPFCLSKCPYCDFNSHVRREPIDEARFVRAFAAEIAATAARVPNRTVSSIFFGGGTPSLMQPATVAALLDAVARHWSIAPDAEVTLEANPTSVEATRFRGYRAAGVNRASLGVQALDDRALAELGRMHTAREALDAVGIARSVFDRVSFDLIYARPQQTPQQWASELKGALAEAGEHLSLYQLTIEPDTPFAALRAAGKLKTPDEDNARALYDTTLELCAAHGLPAYEISNHARPGGECRHNLAYWRAHEYAGVGPGAHGRLDIAGVRHATATEKRPEAWLTRVETAGHGLVTDDALMRDEMADEFLLMGLRLAEGIDMARYAELAGRPLDPERIAMLHEHGLVETTAAGHLRVTLSGFPVLDAVVADLAA